jgi:hypothetical protein
MYLKIVLMEKISDEKHCIIENKTQMLTKNHPLTISCVALSYLLKISFLDFFLVNSLYMNF